MNGARIAGMVLLVLGIVVMLGWLLRSPALLGLLPDPTSMVFNTALCFALAGAALVLPARFLAPSGSMVAAIGALVLIEHLFRVDLGIDWPALHQWRGSANPRPGRMAAAAATAFLIGGTALVLLALPYRRWLPGTLRALALAAGAIGALGLTGYFISANLLFANYRYFGVAPSTAAGLLLLALGLRFYWQRFDWGRAPFFERQDDRIAFTSASVLMLVALGAIVATFAILQETVHAQARDQVQAALKNRSEVFADLVRLRISAARSAALRPAAARNMRMLHAGRDDGSNKANLDAVAASFLKLEFSAIAYRAPDGTVLASGGSFAQSPEMTVPLKVEGTELLWDGGLVLRNRFAVSDPEGPVGEVLTEQPLPVMTRMVNNPAGAGATWDTGLCVAREERLHCFPQRLNPKAFSTPLVNVAGEPLPMARALRGETGTVITRDYRAQNVLAAFGPIGELGLGMVIKVDTAEVLGPIREQLLLAAGLMLVTVAGGALLVRSRVMPLATRLQGALDERAAGLHRAQQMAKLSHVVTRHDGSFEAWSETLPQLIGVEDAAMPRSTREWLQVVHPDDRPVFRRAAIEAGATGARGEVAYRLRRADGEWIHVQQTMESLGAEDGPGGGNRWFNTLQDVTEQRRAEARISRLNRVYAVLSGINSMIVRAEDRDRMFREACTIAVEQGRLSLAFIALVDRDQRRITPVAWAGADEEFARLERPLAARADEVAQGGASRAIHTRRPVIQNDIQANGRGMTYPEEALRRGFRSVASLPLIAGGEVIGVISLFAGEPGFFDDEEMKLLEELANDIAFAVRHLEIAAGLNQALEDLRKSEAGLERRVEERTAELKAANQELEAFSYSVSHDLRAPLRHIAGFADMLNEESGAKLDADSKRYLGVIIESVTQMGQLIDDLLLFSRMGRVEMRQEPVAMAPLVEGVVKVLKEQERNRRIEWDIGALPDVRGDPGLLRQVWVNLLSNAVKYSRQRDPSRIKVNYDAAAGEFVVQDNGAGFDMRYAEKLFGVFQRLHRADEFEGTGIGLANVKRIITRHGGSIRAQGKVGEGAEFRFKLQHNGAQA